MSEAVTPNENRAAQPEAAGSAMKDGSTTPNDAYVELLQVFFRDILGEHCRFHFR